MATRTRRFGHRAHGAEAPCSPVDDTYESNGISLRSRCSFGTELKGGRDGGQTGRGANAERLRANGGKGMAHSGDGSTRKGTWASISLKAVEADREAEIAHSNRAEVQGSSRSQRPRLGEGDLLRSSVGQTEGAATTQHWQRHGEVIMARVVSLLEEAKMLLGRISHEPDEPIKQLTGMNELPLDDAEWKGIVLEGDHVIPSETSADLLGTRVQRTVASAERKRTTSRAKGPSATSSGSGSSTATSVPTSKEGERTSKAQETYKIKDNISHQRDVIYSFIGPKYWHLKKDARETNDYIEEDLVSTGGSTTTDERSCGGRVDDEESASGGRKRKVPLTEDEIEQHYREGRCFNCHTRGHRVRDCQQPRMNTPSNPHNISSTPLAHRDAVETRDRHDISTPRPTITFGATIPEIDLPNHDSRFTVDTPPHFDCFTMSKQHQDEPRRGQEGSPLKWPRMRTNEVNAVRSVDMRPDIRNKLKMWNELVAQPIQRYDERLHIPPRPATKQSNDSTQFPITNPKSKLLESRYPSEPISTEQQSPFSISMTKSKVDPSMPKIPIAKSNIDANPPRIRKVRLKE